MDKGVIEKTKRFIKREFRSRPRFCFNNWKIMYNHSLLVEKFCLELAKKIKCDNLVLRIGALLHDIGKTYDEDEQTLMDKHEELGYEVSKEFLENLNINNDRLLRIKNLFSKEDKTVEKKIIKDADKISFLADPVIQEVYKEWAEKRGEKDRFRDKVEMSYTFYFEVSKKIAKPFYENTKKTRKLNC